MRNTLLQQSLSNSQSLRDRNDLYAERHFKWDSIKKFIYLASAYSSSSYYFDLFSRVLKYQICLPMFFLFAVWLGMAYMFADVFIKQYTHKLDFNQSLNPLLRGVSVGILLQTAFSSLFHARDLADSLRFLIGSLYAVPIWSYCHGSISNRTCFTSGDVIKRCHSHLLTDFTQTSVHQNYMKLFTIFGDSSMSTRFFVIAIVWIGIFFIVTITDETLLKLFKISFLWRTFSTFFIFIFLSPRPDMLKAFIDIMNLRDYDYKMNFNYITDMYGIGFIGVYDMGATSPYTMVDNAVIIFTVVLSVTAIARSLIVRVLVMNMKECVPMLLVDNHHYLFFAVLPLGAEFMHAHKIYIFFLYLNLAMTTTACLAMFTLSVSRQLHDEFRSVKSIYIVGLFCFIGFLFSLPFNTMPAKKVSRILLGLNATTLYLGSLKMTIVMWIYGARRFSTDIQFWLGFKPTKLWRYLWIIMPFILFVMFLHKTYVIYKFYNRWTWPVNNDAYLADLWFLCTFITVMIFHIKTIARFILRSNLVGIFKSSKKYGPPDAGDRSMRRHYDEIIQNRRCSHNCFIFNENFDCNHLPLTFRSRHAMTDSLTSLTSIYDGDPPLRDHSSRLDFRIQHQN